MKKSKKTGKITGILPTGIQILVEMLTPGEATNSSLEIVGKADIGAPQAYVLAIGPGLESERAKLGFKEGDRVVVQGKYVPMPKLEGRERELGILDYTNIKAVLHED